MKIAVIYAKYSSDRQNEQSIDGQIRVCQEYAARNDIVIVDTYIDRAMTGTNDDRESFQKMLKDSDKKEWDIILVYKLDRFSRNKYEMAMHRKHLKDNNIKLVSAMEQILDSPEGILLESLLEGMNQYYSEELSQKTKRGMHETRLKGNFIGGFVNYGYKREGSKLVINEDEAVIVKRIFTEYASGKTVYEITKTLNEEGLLYKGKPFNVQNLYHLLRHEKYTGIYRVNGLEYDKIYPPIVPIETYTIVKARIDKNKHGHHPPDTSYLLRDLLFCKNCGKPIRAYTGYGSPTKLYRYYKCGNKTCKSNKAFNKDILEEVVINALLKLIDNEKCINYLSNQIVTVHNARMKSNTSAMLLEKELNKVNKALTNLLKAIEAGLFTDTTRDRLHELETTKTQLQCKILAEKEKVKSLLTEDKIKQYLLQALKQTPEFLIKLLVERITVKQNRLYITLKYTSPLNNNPDRTPAPDRDYLFTQYQYDCYTYVNKRITNGEPNHYAFDISIFI